MDIPRKTGGTPSFHSARWRLEPLLSQSPIALIAVLAAILYMATSSLLANPSGQSAQDPMVWVVAALLVLFVIGLAWSLYMTARLLSSGPGTRK